MERISNLFIQPTAAILIGILFSVEAYCQNDFDSQKLADNKAVVKRYFEEVINKQRPELLREIYTDDYFFHSLEDGSEGRGLKGFEAFLPYFFKAFPDIHYTIEQMVAEGDKVVVQVTARGTHKNEFWGYPPSNIKINLSEVFFYTLKDGKITENRRLIDMARLDRQLRGEIK